MKKLMMLVMVGFVSFDVSATEVYSCSFDENVSHVIPGAISEKEKRYLKSRNKKGLRNKKKAAELISGL